MIRNIKTIFNEDQSDRRKPDFEKKIKYYSKRDEGRRQEVDQLLILNKLQSGKDLYQSAMIFHHSDKLADLEKAKNLAHKSIDLQFEKAKWLYAAITDQTLLLKGKPQMYGTQYFKKDPSSKWKIAQIDLGTTDEDRAKYNVPGLEELKKQVDKLNDN
jgi:hypothetical protein